MSDGEDDSPKLSAATMDALLEFYQEEEERADKLREVEEGNVPDNFQENWNLSQFWYSEETAEQLARECVAAVGGEGSVACISCPTLYRALLALKHHCNVQLLEYDTRFACYKDNYHFYDYRSPLAVPPDLREHFDLVVADPPYLSEDCLTKTAVSVKFLAKTGGRVILCTGEVMGELAGRLLGVEKQPFTVAHANNLSNPFVCFANYTFQDS